MPKDLTFEDLGSRERIANARALAWYPAETDVSIRPGWFYHPNQDEQVKTPEKLIDIYFSSVGRNSVLLLNIPPDKRGLIHENDAGNLAGMRKILDETFKMNFAAGAEVRASSEKKGRGAELLVDAKKNTFWAAEESDKSTWVELDLEKEATFGCALLQEDIRVGQRVEKFLLEYWDGKEWRPFAQGTTIGYKRLLRFPAVRAKQVRLRIEQSRRSPVLSAFGLFKLTLS